MNLRLSKRTHRNLIKFGREILQEASKPKTKNVYKLLEEIVLYVIHLSFYNR